MSFLLRKQDRPDETPAPLALPDGATLPVAVRRSARARRIALRLSAARDAVQLVLPVSVPLAHGLTFLESRRGWVVAQVAKLPQSVPFVDGAMIPVLGVEHRLTWLGSRRGVPPFALAAGRIEVSGHQEHLARRTEAGLKALARTLLGAKTAALAGRLGKPAGKVTIGDAASRWGSCSAAGNIKYSWRLVLVPERVMDYVAAHEVAHLVEMNHSARFWRLVETLYGPFEAERNWLKRNGPRLQRYG
jgi:predicted metal-dependent hydrolase